MILGYNVSESAGRPVTGSPSLDKIIGGLRHNRISYVAINGGEVVEIEEF